MQQAGKHVSILAILSLMLIALTLLNISLGSVNIPFNDIFSSFMNAEVSKETYRYIILDYRLPKAFTAIIAGSGLAISGLLMQTMFRNPLAGPYVLGLSSGASLGVAIVIMGATLIGGSFVALALSKWTLVIASSLGSLMVLFAVVLASVRLRDTMAILIVG